MEVTSGADWKNGNGFGQSYSISLDDADGETALGTELWDDLSLAQRIRWLTAHADEKVVRQMLSAEAISKDFARDRLLELKALKKEALDAR